MPRKLSYRFEQVFICTTPKLLFETSLMLSRRNIRIKVMQMLYSMSRDEQLTYPEALRRYHGNIQSAFDMYLYNLYLLLGVTSYAEKDRDRRKVKHLPTEEDKIFTDRIYRNPLIRALVTNQTLQQEIIRLELDNHTDQDNVRKIYLDFAKTDEYKAYLVAEDIDESHRQILLKLYKHCTSSEVFNEIIEDYSANWPDDKSLVMGTIKKTIKALPSEEDFLNKYRPGDDTVIDFGEKMFQLVHHDDEKLLAIIEPILKNWDADRVAIMDMILIKMALIELMTFSSIPTKVTLNEFVEIAKSYSTDKSKDFINGILDRLMKKLDKEGKIKKEGRGLRD